MKKGLAYTAIAVLGIAAGVVLEYKQKLVERIVEATKKAKQQSEEEQNTADEQAEK
jgi:hypothetical protein